LNEYVSLDAEMGFIEDHTTVMALVFTQAMIIQLTAAAHQTRLESASLKPWI
jgi:aspartyl/asparaginyl-tRNA synthetase